MSIIDITGVFGAKFKQNGDFFIKNHKYKHINKFGYNTSVGGTYAPITDLGTSVLPASAGVISVVSSSEADSNITSPLGTGARTVEIEGLDTNYNSLTETIDLKGSTSSITQNSFLRIFRMKVKEAGSGEINVGNITASIGGQEVARIKVDKGQTLMAVYTIPAGYRAYLLKFHVSLSKNQEANAQLRSKVLNSGAWQVKGEFGTFSQSINYDYPIPLIFEEKTDLQVRAKAGATSEMGAIFDLILEEL